MDIEAVVVEALAESGIAVGRPEDDSEPGADLVLAPGEANVPVELKRRSLVTDQVAERLLADHVAGRAVLVVVGDRVTEQARKLLVARGGGYLDLRGRFSIRADRMVIDIDVEPLNARLERTHALSGRAGLEVATWLMMRPQPNNMAVRQVARDIGRSASTVSEVLSALRRDGLVDAKNAVVDTRLFWRVADHWATRRTYLAQLPFGDDATAGALRLSFDVVEEAAGWALSDSVAAASYGAPMAVRADPLLDFYVPDQMLVRRAMNLLGAAEQSSSARCAVRVAPVPAVCRYRVGLDASLTEWPLAHPLFVALDIAQDAGRGREILDAWTPDERWTRVW